MDFNRVSQMPDWSVLSLDDGQHKFQKLQTFFARRFSIQLYSAFHIITPIFSLESL
jgi:hypothetical protein